MTFIDFSSPHAPHNAIRGPRRPRFVCPPVPTHPHVAWQHVAWQQVNWEQDGNKSRNILVLGPSGLPLGPSSLPSSLPSRFPFALPPFTSPGALRLAPGALQLAPLALPPLTSVYVTWLSSLECLFQQKIVNANLCSIRGGCHAIFTLFFILRSTFYQAN